MNSKRLIELDFDSLVLNKQDRSNEYGYHWVETKERKDENRKHQICTLIKTNDEGMNFYLPISPPYEICREYNFPEKHLGSPIVLHTETECKAIRNLLPINMFVPTLEFIKTIEANTWMEIYQEIVAMYPEKIGHIHEFNFFVLSDDEKYKEYYLKCYPFLNIIKSDNTYKYGSNGMWRNHSFMHTIGNIIKFYKNFYDDDDKLYGMTLPIVMRNQI